MLSGVAETLVRQGWLVVLPCRRYHPIAVPEPKPEPKQGVAAVKALRARGHRPTATAAAGCFETGRALWVEARWDRPRELAGKAETALRGPADLMVAWVHDQYRRSVLGACERLLAPGAPVVEVRQAGGPPIEPEPVLAAHPTQLVLVGTMSEIDDARPLCHTELANAIGGAVTRAVDGHATSLHQVGHSRPLVR
ncbi:hypothetical protein GKO32_32010 [Amycolatopsis sp. RM579]|uniref:Uncharacterized protein n=2 Tax=Amycolatopsis pithecellobii TaxID=664692 RepID=A0A6N7ZA29_9PSEU|nr:hypothetical protein [Amycolatopsis pithecellobii]